MVFSRFFRCFKKIPGSFGNALENAWGTPWGAFGDAWVALGDALGSLGGPLGNLGDALEDLLGRP